MRENTPTGTTENWERIKLNQSHCEPQFAVSSKQDGFVVLKTEVEEVSIQRMDCDDGSLEALDDEGWSKTFSVLQFFSTEKRSEGKICF